MEEANHPPGPAKREFLKTALSAAGVVGFPTIVPASAMGADGATAPSDRITVGCIGVGVTYNDYRELLERKDIDALMLATGERWTPIIGADAARLGKHMYYEKPLALTVADAKAIREAVQRYGVVFQFGTQQRSSNYFRTACELVRNGKIGHLQKVVIGCSGPTQGAPEKPTEPPPGS